jgi:hypothetical protein
MNRTFKTALFILTVSYLFSSCYAYTTVVGKGAQGTQATSKWNNYVLFGLAPVGISDPKAMAGGAEDYTVFTRQSFVNGLISAITFGIYTPTTTTVTK